MSITFSIVTVSFNDLSGLRLTFDSIVKQTYQSFEWINIDADSRDGTERFHKSIKEKNFKVVSEPDDGLYDGMNKGLALCEGEYVIFMNSGDCFAHSDVLSKLAHFLEQNREIKFIYGDAIDVLDSGESFPKPARNHSSKWYGMFARHQSMVYSMAPIRKNSLVYRDKEFPSAADYAFTVEFLNLLNSRDEIGKVNFAICKFLIGGFSFATASQSRKEQVQIKRQFLGLNRLKTFGVYWIQSFLFFVKYRVPMFIKSLKSGSQ